MYRGSRAPVSWTSTSTTAAAPARRRCGCSGSTCSNLDNLAPAEFVEGARRRLLMLAAIGNLFSWTVTAFIAFLLMLQEALALRTGTDPVNNGLRSVVRSFPRSVYALAVVIGMLLGHLLWP